MVFLCGFILYLVQHFPTSEGGEVFSKLCYGCFSFFVIISMVVSPDSSCGIPSSFVLVFSYFKWEFLGRDGRDSQSRKTMTSTGKSQNIKVRGRNTRKPIKVIKDALEEAHEPWTRIL
ncbi:hypothetical protein BD770DRAFT_457919 [Pilaira anomala]|nr:hypothetical protein BD770DRAFT_457919 [Pilaira anomala]